MARRSGALTALARTIEVRGQLVRPFSFGVLVVPRDTDFSSWSPVGGVVIYRTPGGDGRPPILDLHGGLYVPPLEQIIQAFHVHWPTTWGAPPGDDVSVEHLSIVSQRTEGGAFPKEAGDMDRLADIAVAMAEEMQAAASFARVRDDLDNAVRGDWKRFIGLGFANVLMRHVVFGAHHRLEPLARDQMLRLVAPAGREEERHFADFLDWWDSSPEARRLAGA